ncbi:hypothetical protein [Streptomyces sp. NPDC056944]|uniref:hypothetical protein n=1 Tax=unclassified Streptomyces TaxID=2593676 RepID=UPI00363DE3FD
MTTRSELAVFSLRAYSAALKHGEFHTTEIARDVGCDEATADRIRVHLSKLRLLAEGHPDGGWRPVDPEVAEVELRLPLEQRIHVGQQELARLHHTLDQFTGLYREHTRAQRTQETIRVLTDPADVQQEVGLMMRRCTKEMVTMQPGGGRSAETIRAVLPPTLELLNRGVEMRTLYQHTARASLTTRTYVRQVAEGGAQIRTTGEAFERLIIFDAETVFVPAARCGRQVPGAAVVTDPTVVNFMYRTFESMWQSAQEFEAHRHDYQQAAAELRGRILQLMAAGLKDDVIARRLGMATRTCRRYITGITEEIGAVSRFQAGVKAARLGLLPDEEEMGALTPGS